MPLSKKPLLKKLWSSRLLLLKTLQSKKRQWLKKQLPCKKPPCQKSQRWLRKPQWLSKLPKWQFKLNLKLRLKWWWLRKSKPSMTKL